MSGAEPNTAAAAEDHHVIKFYRDVGDEVDSHFARALHLSKHPNFSSEKEGFSPVAATYRPFLPPPLRHPRLAPILRTPDTPASWPRMPRPKTFLFPELASLLVHPDVDSYGDAPKVPGQPDLSVSPPSFLEYIHCVEEVLPPAVIQGYMGPLHSRFYSPSFHHLHSHAPRNTPFIDAPPPHLHHSLSHLYPPVPTHHYPAHAGVGHMAHHEQHPFGFSEEDLQHMLN